MGIFDSLRLAPSAVAASGAKGVRFASPWTGNDAALAAIKAGMFGADYAPITRAEAMRVPAIAKARAILVGTLAHQPLNVYNANGELAALPSWVQGTNTDTPLWHRMAWTIDDILFYGWSLWVKQMAGTEIMTMMRVPFDMWDFDAEGYVTVKVGEEWKRADDKDIVLFAGPQEGLLEIAADTIREYRALQKTVLGRALTPAAEIEIKQTDGTTYTSQEIDEMVEAFIASRRKVDSLTVGYTPPGIDLIYHDETNGHLVEARNAARLDVASFVNLPAQLLDASLSTATLTYSTKEGARNELIDYSLSFWADPIASRLSQDDIVAPGEYSRFDMTEFVATVNAPASPTTED